MAVKAFSPSDFASELARQLSTRTRRVRLFLGAGASVACGLPDVASLKRIILDAIKPDARTEALFHARTLEEVLSWIRRAKALLHDTETLDGFDSEQLGKLDKRICALIVDSIRTPTDIIAYDYLALWLSGVSYSTPVELFTVNYDILIERGLEDLAVPYFDGFVGAIRGRFRDDLVESGGITLSPAFARLWKLHGSVNWVFDETVKSRRVVRLGRESASGEIAAIYPSDEKYDDSRRVPFVVLMDRFRRALSESESLLLITGYSFGDDHLNEMIFDAAQRYPRNSIVAFCYDEIPKILIERVPMLPSVTIVGRKEYILGGMRHEFSTDEHPVKFISDGQQCILGDFTNLSGFLAQRERETPNVLRDDADLSRVLARKFTEE